ncbi:nucleoside hydrolase [Rhizobium johnstonii]|uniref:nucleoside hydrolase n=1 Tax=Rhizobium TaxID=379 RepID=UPI001030119B|nr:nucleoside hydrolase [Rhizobium leguminosarum]TBF70691.1 nucleoside hydrolase [Rhizobium leguminosarum]TBG93438.1 nucleoside hydrolase [Rhizobium leguminosarum]TBG95941.1 nucleoside hydrolase [Rhizobium leguminosarum]TBH28817.1 nucleoside hydrolase [Rhizobium leguminosarum]TBH50263.1 nucleoside hydrolase [Rhizobium leguminosarum]
MRRKLILDVDTGTDDAVAIMLAALHPALELLAVTTVNGNVEVQYCTENTLRTLDFIGRGDVPVYQGCPKPLVRPDFPVPRSLKKDDGIHIKTLPLPPAVSAKQDKNAVEFLIETFRNATDDIVLVPVGPLTNIAAAITADADFVKNVPEIVIMGGAHYTGNVTPAAEFNVWADPEAAAIVFSAGFAKLTLVPLDATFQALVTGEQAKALEDLGSNAGIAASRFIAQRIKGYDATQPMKVSGAAPVHDAVCVAYLVRPDLLETRHVNIVVETHGIHTVGRTVIDVNRRGNNEPNGHVAFGAQADIFIDMLMTVFRGGRRDHD